MILYFKQIGNLLYKLLILLIIYSFCRLFFYLVNLHAFSENSIGELLKIFFYGIRFDYAVVIYYNILFIFLYLLPFNFVQNKYYRRVLAILFYAGNFFLILFNFTDCEYFKYTGKRSTADIFGYIFMNDDAVTLLPQFLKDFWYLALSFAAVTFGGIYVMSKVPFKKIERHQFTVRNWIYTGILFILLPVVLFIGARGTGLKPIRIISASRYTASQNIPLILNTPFTIFLTINDETVKPIAYFSDKELSQRYSPEQVFTTKGPRRTDKTVFTGRTRTNKIVLWDKSGTEKAGDLVNIRITHPQTWVLKGKLQEK